MSGDVVLTKAQHAACDTLGFLPQSGYLYGVGPHRFVVADLQSPEGVMDAAGVAEGASVAFTDPPWNVGIGKTFRKQAGEVPDAIDLRAVFDGLALVLGGVRHAAAVWMGSDDKGRELAALALTRGGLGFIQRRPVTYEGVSKAATLSVGTRTPPPEGEAALPPANDSRGAFAHGGEAICTRYLGWAEAQGWQGTVVDPFVGQGVTARVAQRRGWACAGSEIHAGRLAVTLAWLAKATQSDVAVL